MYMLKEMPKTARPRERLLQEGAHVLSNDELLAILFRTGIKDLSVIELAKKVLYPLEDFSDLNWITKEELEKIQGLKEAKIATLLAAIELGRRLAQAPRRNAELIRSPEDVYRLLGTKLRHLEQEHGVCLYLNTKGELIKEETVFIGTLNQTLIHPREIFKTAVRVMASAILFVHNHPTGDARPSSTDIKTTDRLMKVAELMGMDLVDHIIIGKNEYYSIKEQKHVKSNSL